jgi:hypothetical protein
LIRFGIAQGAYYEPLANNIPSAGFSAGIPEAF